MENEIKNLKKYIRVLRKRIEHQILCPDKQTKSFEKEKAVDMFLKIQQSRHQNSVLYVLFILVLGEMLLMQNSAGFLLILRLNCSCR